MIFPLPAHLLEKPIRFLRPGLWQRIGGNLRVDPGKLLRAGWQPLHDTRDGLTALIQEENLAVSRIRKTIPPSTPTPKT